jgi:hypothetical protein
VFYVRLQRLFVIFFTPIDIQRVTSGIQTETHVVNICHSFSHVNKNFDVSKLLLNLPNIKFYYNPFSGSQFVSYV